MRDEDTVTETASALVFTIAAPPEEIRWFLVHIAALRVASHVVRRRVPETVEAMPAHVRTDRVGLVRP